MSETKQADWAELKAAELLPCEMPIDGWEGRYRCRAKTHHRDCRARFRRVVADALRDSKKQGRIEELEQQNEVEQLRAERDALKQANSNLAAAAVVPDNCAIMLKSGVKALDIYINDLRHQLDALKAACAPFIMDAADWRALLAAVGEGEER